MSNGGWATKEFTNQRHCVRDRKSTRLNSSHSQISYAVFCLKKKKEHDTRSLIGNNQIALSRHANSGNRAPGPRAGVSATNNEKITACLLRFLLGHGVAHEHV